MNSRTCCSLIVFLTTVLSVSAGTFTNAFDSGLPSGTAGYGTAFVDSTGGPDGSGCLKMTTGVNSQAAGFIFNDLDGGAQIGGFVASFQLLLGGGTTAAPADGFSLNFANDLPNGAMSEIGAGTGIIVEWHTYANTSSGIGIDVWWQGAMIATFPMATASLALWPQNVAVDPSYWADVFIQLHPDGTLDVNYNGSAIYAGLATGFVPMAGRFGFGARTGGDNENCFVDNLGITTTPPSMPQFIPLASAPTGTIVTPNPIITVQMWDGIDAQVDTNTITMTLNATNVTPTITQTNGVTTVQYASSVLPSGSTNTVVVTFADNSASPTTQTDQFSFVVASYPALPANSVATADTTKPGFTQRIFQGGTATVGSIAAAENLLGGFLINPTNAVPFPNTAQTNTDGTWTFVQTNVLNYNIFAPTAAGDFPGDVQYPGLPGTNGSTINFALEAITYLYLTPGAYTFGVNSDDGFQLTSGAVQVGVFDAGRGAADTLFSFVVTQTGYYPFRLVYFQGGGGASL